MIKLTNKNIKLLGASLLILTYVSPVKAKSLYQDRGLIFNGSGEGCYFTQEDEIGSSYFSNFTSNVGTVTFKNPECMYKNTQIGQMVNINQINRKIAQWYTNTHFNFYTSALYTTSTLQKTGVCMQSKLSKNSAITISYITNTSGSIYKFKHGPALGGCTSK